MFIEIVLTDITTETTDGIVNAANEGLRAGSGVCGAIHNAAGPLLEKACQNISGHLLPDETGDFVNPTTVRCPTGDAITTGAFDLPTSFVIHAVGPIWGTHQNAEELLSKAHQSVLREADRYGMKSISIPAISTGIFGFPLELAAPAAIKGLTSVESGVEHVRLTMIDETTASFYRQALQK